MNLNIQCLKNKVNALNILACSENIDILCLTEHWLSEHDYNLYNLKHFTNTSCFNRTQHIHGGVCIFTRNSLECQDLETIKKLSVEIDCEICAVYIPQSNTVVITAYRSPYGVLLAFLDIVDTALNIILNTYRNSTTIILAADFNVNFLVDSRDRNEIYKVMNSYDMKQQIQNPTRIRNNSRTIIDNMFTNKPEEVTAGDTIACEISDHKPQILKILQKEDNKIIKRRVFSDENIISFIAELSSESWIPTYACQTPKSIFTQFMKAFTNHFEAAFPIMATKTLKYPSYGSKMLLEKKQTLKLLYRFNDQFGNTETQDILERQKQNFIKLAEKERLKQNSEKIRTSDNKSKTIWEIINHETARKTKRNIPNIPSCEELNNFFTTQAQDLLQHLSISDENTAMKLETKGTRASFKRTNKTEIENIINNLKNKTTPDTYGISTRLIKMVSTQVSTPLAYIFNKCFEFGICPDELKIAKVTPIYKKGAHSNPTNYRPISVLPAFSKIFESLIVKRINDYFLQTNLFCIQQYGFRQNKSTTDAMHDLMTYVCAAINEKDHCVSQMLDLTKAFDLISHEILFKKLNHYGIRDRELKLLKSYFTSRKQYVDLSGECSSLREVTRGVPQGSILGPTLFIIYINDLPSHITGHSILYADDTTLMTRHPNRDILMEELNTNSAIAESWFESNELILNREKTTTLEFVMDKWTTTSKPARFLGLWFDSRLSWTEQVKTLSLKLSRTSYAIRRIRRVAGADAALSAYHSLFASSLTYGIEIWGLSAHMETILIEQKRAIRSLAEAPLRTPCRPLFKSFGILTAPGIYLVKVLTNIHDQKQNLIKAGDCHNYGTRARNKLRAPAIRLHSAEYLRRGIAEYNACPEAWKQYDTGNFARKLKAYLTAHPPYTIKEVTFM